MKRTTKFFVCLIVFFAGISVNQTSVANCFRSGSSSSKHQARNVINKTAYIIEQAYDVAYFYDYWTSSYLSRAVYYNDYAQKRYRSRSYRSAINYSLRAREYALYVLDNCDDYWEFFYYTYYGWSHVYGYNPSFAYAAGYRDGYYDGYYAAYCHRHNHDYHKDPHYRPNGHYDKPHHGGHHGGHNNGGAVIGRGNTGTIINGGGTVTRPGFVPTKDLSTGNYKNLNLAEYFSDEEVKLLKDVPNETTLETNFRKENPNIVFNDRNLSTNKAILDKNKEKAQEFSKDKKNDGLVGTIKKPAKVVNTNKETTKPVTKPTIQKKEDDSNDKRLSKPKDATNSNATLNRNASGFTNESTRPASGSLGKEQESNRNSDIRNERTNESPGKQIQTNGANKGESKEMNRNTSNNESNSNSRSLNSKPSKSNNSRAVSKSEDTDSNKNMRSSSKNSKSSGKSMRSSSKSSKSSGKSMRSSSKSSKSSSKSSNSSSSKGSRSMQRR